MKPWRAAILAAIAIAMTAGTVPASEEPEKERPASEPDQASAGAGGAEPAAEPAEGAAGATRGSRPVSVSVEGKLPYIPTSNTIATRLPLLLRLTPANVGTVNELVLREQGAVVLGDALRNISGVNPQTYFDVVDWFSIRGFDSQSSGLVLTDGAREPEVTFYSMYNVERVEVLKGPSGFLYGSDPLSGVVNIVRRQPAAGTFGRAGASFGTWNTSEATVDYNISNKDATRAFRINALHRASDFYRDRMDNDTAAVNPSFTWRLDDRTSLNVNAEHVRSDYVPDSGLPLVDGSLPDVPRERSYQSPFDESLQRLSRLQVDLERRVNDTWTLRNKVYYRDLSWNSDGTILGGTAPIGPGGSDQVFRALVLLDDRQRFAGNQAEAILSVSTGPVRHEVLMGFEVARLGDDFTLDLAQLPTMDVQDPEETATRPDPVPSQAADGRSQVMAPYVIDQVKFSDKWSALAGARYDVIDFESAASALDPNTFQMVDDDLSRRDTKLSPMAGVVFSPVQRLSFYANAGRSFSPASPRLLGDDLRPEESRQVEVGTRIELPAKVHLTLAAYRMERDNIGIPDDTGITQQAGDQRSRGVEMDIAAEPREGLRLFGSYAYNDAELTRFAELVQVGVDGFGRPIYATFDRSGNRAAFAPLHLASAWVSQRFANGLGVAGGGRYVSEQFIAEDNAYAIDPYVVYDAAVSFRQGKWEFALNLKNIGSREYETRGFGSTAVIPASPFAAYAGVQYAF
jgi:TonB-dependent siderophore receptor